jgi:predicted GTPase
MTPTKTEMVKVGVMNDVTSLNRHAELPNTAEERLEPTGTDSSQGKLRTYTKAKLAVAGQLRGLLEVLKKRGGESRARRCEELMVKLAEDRFTLAVLGQFKRGKSSLMNALIGRELLPTGVLPLTSAITILKFGPSERLVVLRERLPYPDIVPVSELAAFVTEKGNPGNFKKVKTATVEVPLPFLRRGLEFVDTPGVGSSIQANTNTTYGFLPECDAALFVTSVETPFTKVEVEFLRIIREHMHKIFFVVNKIDLLANEAERAEVFKFITQTIRQELDVPNPKILPVSSRDGLNALLRHDNERYSRSGMQALQETLGGFLSEEKGAVLLVAIIDRTIRVLDEESEELAIYKAARALPETERIALLAKLKTGFQQARSFREGIFGRLRDLTVNRTVEFVASEIDAELRREAKSSLGLFDRLPSSIRWMPAQWIIQRYAKRLGQRAQRRLWRQMVGRLALLNFDSTAEFAVLWRQIGTNLNGLPALATALFDLPCAQFSSDEAGSCGIELNPQASFPPVTNWRPSAPHWLNWLPIVFVRSFVKRRMDQHTGSFIEVAKRDVTNRITELANNAVDRAVEQADKLAEEMEARVTASITGQRPPRPASQQGFAPLEELGWGNSALESIRANLLTLRNSLNHVGSAEPPVLEQLPIPSQIVKMPAAAGD